MSTNPLRDLQAKGRDIRNIGWGRLPVNIERACVVFCNNSAYRDNAAYVSSIRMEKLCQWANCETYFICEPSVAEFVDTINHFSTQCLKFCLFYFAGNKLDLEADESDPALKCTTGTVGPDLIYSAFDQKNPECKIVLMLDGINNPSKWDPSTHELDEQNIFFIAPTPDYSQSHLQQFDLRNESVFLSAFYCQVKSDPTITAATLTRNINKEIAEFGQKVFCKANPPSAIQDVPLMI